MCVGAVFGEIRSVSYASVIERARPRGERGRKGGRGQGQKDAVRAAREVTTRREMGCKCPCLG